MQPNVAGSVRKSDEPKVQVATHTDQQTNHISAAVCSRNPVGSGVGLGCIVSLKVLSPLEIDVVWRHIPFFVSRQTPHFHIISLCSTVVVWEKGHHGDNLLRSK